MRRVEGEQLVCQLSSLLWGQPLPRACERPARVPWGRGGGPGSRGVGARPAWARPAWAVKRGVPQPRYVQVPLAAGGVQATPAGDPRNDGRALCYNCRSGPDRDRTVQARLALGACLPPSSAAAAPPRRPSPFRYSRKRSAPRAAALPPRAPSGHHRDSATLRPMHRRSAVSGCGCSLLRRRAALWQAPEWRRLSTGARDDGRITPVREPLTELLELAPRTGRQ
jgi:hypothetical protein